MKRFLTIFFVILSVVANAQQLHFAYLQTDTHKPFYVILNKKTYSSTAAGYIILPKLQNGDLSIRIGFAKSEEAEQDYLLQIKEADQGLLIKDFGGKGWGLFNMQTMGIQYAGVAAQERAKLAATEKAEAEKVRQQAEQELFAQQAKQRDDSLKIVMVFQKHYADSVATAEAQNIAQRNQNDSISNANKLVAEQNHVTDSVNTANAIAIEQRNYQDSINKANTIAAQQKSFSDSISTAQTFATQQKSFADSVDNAKAIALQQKNYTDSVNTVKATAAENKRLEKIANADAKAKEAAIEKDKKTIVSIPKKKIEQAKSPDGVPPHMADPDVQVPPPVMLQQTFTDTGWHYAYRITNQNKRETIEAFIPSSQPKVPVVTDTADSQKDTVIKVPVQSLDSTVLINKNVEIDTTVTLQKLLPDTAQTNKPIIAGKATTASVPLADTIVPQVEKSILNTNCKAIADEKDFYNTRRKIASAVGTEQMLIVARKQLKDKCYTTEQLRNLSVLFLSDEGRYRFLDAAYPFAFDAYRYNTLQDLLIDTYYIQRFKAMLH